MKPTPAEKAVMRRYTRRHRSYSLKEWEIWLVIGDQSFKLHWSYANKQEADWMRLMLARALLQIVAAEKPINLPEQRVIAAARRTARLIAKAHDGESNIADENALVEAVAKLDKAERTS